MANILNADNGAISGSAGIKLSSDTSGVLNIQTNGTTAISISSSQVVSFGATSSLGTVYFGDGSASAPSIGHAGDTNTGIYFPGADQVAITTAGTQRFVVDASGNAGLGVTPSAWATNSRVFQVINSSLETRTDNPSYSTVVANGYINTSNSWTYVSSDYASRYTQFQGQHLWFTAGSGTAGTAITFTQAMTLDASGNLGVGTTSPQAYTNYTVLTVDNATNGGVVSVRRNGNALLNLYTASGEGRVEAANSAFLSFYTTSAERARIDVAGNFGLGVTPSAWSQGRALEILNAGYGLWNGSGSPEASIYLTAGAVFNGGFKYSATSARASHYYQFQGAHVWSTAPAGTAGNAITFTQAMTLDTSGNLTLGLTSSSGLATSAPTYITLGALFSDTVGTASKAKLKLFEATGFIYGFGISSNLLENHVPSNASVAWFINNSERMRLNTSGYLTVPNQPMFAGEHNATEGPTAGDAFVNWTVNVNTVTAAWNASTGVYTVPVAGRYFVACSLLRNTGSGSGGVYLQQNGTNVIRLFYCDSGSADSGYAMGSGQTIVDCAINDTLRVVQETSGVSWYGDGTGLGNFTIYLIG